MQLQGQLPGAQLLHQAVLVFGEDQLALTDHANAIRHFFGFLDVVRGENNGDSALLQTAHHIPHIPAQRHIDPGGGLVEEQHLRLMGQRLGDQHPPLHAAGQIHDPLITLVPQRQLAQDLLQQRIIARLAKQPAAEAHGSPDAVEHVVGQLLRHQANALAGLTILAAVIEPIDQHLSAGRVNQATDNTDQRGLAGPVRAQQREDFTTPNLQTHALERLKTTGVGLGQVVHCNNAVHAVSAPVYVRRHH